MDTLLTRNWWAVGLRGLAALIFGILALIFPGTAVLALVLVFGFYALVDGILTLRWPFMTAFVLLYFIAAWAIITGIMEIFEAIELRRVIRNEWLLILSGIISVIFGLILIIFPGAGTIGIIVVIGIYAIVFGILLLVLAWQLWQMHRGHGAPIAGRFR